MDAGQLANPGANFALWTCETFGLRDKIDVLWLGSLVRSDSAFVWFTNLISFLRTFATQRFSMQSDLHQAQVITITITPTIQPWIKKGRKNAHWDIHTVTLALNQIRINQKSCLETRSHVKVSLFRTLKTSTKRRHDSSVETVKPSNTKRWLIFGEVVSEGGLISWMFSAYSGLGDKGRKKNPSKSCYRGMQRALFNIYPLWEEQNLLTERINITPHFCC